MQADNSGDLSNVQTIQPHFDTIYQHKVWQLRDSVNDNPVSGPGSSFRKTAKFRYFLELFCKTNRYKSFLDIGSGDLHWMKSHYCFESMNYQGVEVSRVVLNSLDPILRHKVMHYDFTSLMELPEVLKNTTWDVILCKDVLQHLKSDEIKRLLEKVLNLNFNHLIVNDHDVYYEQLTDDQLNDIYRYRPTNLSVSPFNVDTTKVCYRDDYFRFWDLDKETVRNMLLNITWK